MTNSKLVTRYEEIVDLKAIGGMNTRKNNELLNLAKKENLRPAKDNLENVLVLAIDMQNDFMETGELPVAGSHQDVANFTKFIYDNMNAISRIAVSLDTHQPHQIFHAAWWTDGNNNPINPTEKLHIITTESLKNKEYLPAINPKASIEYVEELEKRANKPLIIWPYHCLEGTFGQALEGQFANMVYFYSEAKKSVVQRLVKGTDPMSEMYGIIRPEYSQKNLVNLDFLNALEKFDKIVIGGEAKSHCVLESIRQIAEFYQNRPEVTSKIYILEDCMSNIGGFEKQSDDAFENFKKQYKMNIVKSTDLVL